MNELTLKTRLGKRLKSLLRCIPEQTDEVWDLCCDHGAIGRAVIESNPDCTVVFNDIHPDIMTRLGDALTQFNARRYRLITAPAQTITLPANKRLTVILAGVGAEQCIEILNNLFKQPAADNAYFIISPATKTYFVRQFLCQNSVFLANEQVVTENRRSYEIICIQRQPASGTTLMTRTAAFLFGQCWRPEGDNHLPHLKKQLNYYQSSRKNDLEIRNICAGYRNLIKNLTADLEE
jgi:tRNA (adenine22-N1)-methyltransferase